MITQSTDGSVLLNWIARRGNDNTMTFTCLTSGGAAFSLVGYTIAADLYRFGTSNSIMSGTVTSGGANGIFTVTFTATQTNTLNAPDIFFGRIRVTHPDATVHEWFNIQFVLNTELYDGSVTSSVTATVNVGTTNITTTINPGNYGGIYSNVYGATTADYVEKSVYFFGDSKTVGIGQPNAYTRWTTRVASILGVTEVNKGVSSQTMSAGANSMQNRFSEIPTYNATTCPYLFFSYSTNDLQSAVSTSTFQTAYQACLDAAYAKGWPPSAIYVLNQTPDPGYEASVTAYNVVFAALPGSVARNSGLNVIDVYSAWPTSGYARYLSGPHETGIGSDITAQAVINAMPLQAITRNSQAGAFNGLLEAQSIKVRNTTASSEPYFFVAADRTGSLLLRRANDVYINNSIGATTAQVSNICIDGQVQAGTAFFTGTFATPPVSGNGLHIYTFSSNTYLDANNAALSSANILNLKASSILATCTIQGVSLFATGLSNPTGVAGVLGTFGSRAVLIGRNASSPLPVQVGEGTALYVNTDGRVFQGGLTTPTAWFHIRAGAAAANSAPLKFTSGTNLTTPEAGAMEYNGTNLFFTRVSTREGVLIGNRGASAPSTTAAGTVTNRYGGATNFLGDPNTWFSVVGDDGSTYKIPAYT